MATNLVVENAFIEFNKRLGILASGDYSVAPEVFERTVKDNTSGTPIETAAAIQDIFFDNVRMYLVDTNQNMLLNDVTNTNMYLRESMTKELERSASLRDKTFNDIHKTRERYMGKKYAINHYNFVGTTLQFTMFVILIVALCFTLAKEDKITKTVATYVSMFIIVIYLIILLMFIKQNQLRRKDDWNKFYFSMKQTDTGGSCS